MAKKARKKKTTKKKIVSKKTPAKPKATGGLKEKASEILLSRNTELFDLLAQTSELIRAASFTEVQVQMQRDLVGQIETAKKDLVSDLVVLKKENAESKKKIDALAKEKGGLEKETTKLDKEVTKLSRQAEKLSDKKDKLKKESTNLEKRVKLLREDVERLESIRKDYMDRISKYRSMREDLIR
ncbi:MAG: hypothetical protein ACYTFG_10425 [Planctomycetota bacterium]|jgi:chromosome segregation ATPase